MQIKNTFRFTISIITLRLSKYKKQCDYTPDAKNQRCPETCSPNRVRASQITSLEVMELIVYIYKA